VLSIRTCPRASGVTDTSGSFQSTAKTLQASRAGCQAAEGLNVDIQVGVESTSASPGF
jgi:hypothetical protein